MCRRRGKLSPGHCLPRRRQEIVATLASGVTLQIYQTTVGAFIGFHDRPKDRTPKLKAPALNEAAIEARAKPTIFVNTSETWTLIDSMPCRKAVSRFGSGSISERWIQTGWTEIERMKTAA